MWGIFLFFVSCHFFFSQTTIYEGEYGWTSYEEGNSPLIIITQHNGNIFSPTPSIPDREPGCYDSSTSTCIWEHDCEINYSLPQSSSLCGVTTGVDSYTMNLAECIRDRAIIEINGFLHYPHLIKNNLARIKLDPNREIGEATLSVSSVENAYNEIHNDWLPMASDSAEQQCGYGLIFDIHGQGQNNLIHLGYRLDVNDLNQSDTFIDNDEYTSIESLRDNFGHLLSNVVRGSYSLGEILHNLDTNNYDVVPSQTRPNANGLNKYYMGDYTVKVHGSRDGGYIDAIMCETPTFLRDNGILQEQLCENIATALVTWMEYWHNISDCQPAFSCPCNCSSSIIPEILSISPVFVNNGTDNIVLDVDSWFLDNIAPNKLTVNCQFYEYISSSWNIIGYDSNPDINENEISCVVPSLSNNVPFAVNILIYHTESGNNNNCVSDLYDIYKGSLCIDIYNATGLTHTFGDAYIKLIDEVTNQIIAVTSVIRPGRSIRKWDEQFCSLYPSLSIRAELWDENTGPHKLDATGHFVSSLEGSHTITLGSPGQYPTGNLHITLTRVL